MSECRALYSTWDRRNCSCSGSRARSAASPASDAPAVLAAALGSWSFPPLGTAAILLGVAVYARGWWALHRQRPDRFPPFRLAAFAAAAAMLLVAIASPLEALSGLLLTVHMAQHFLLVMVVPPLTWLSAPAIPLLRGLPVAGARAIGPFLAAPELRRLSHRLTHPVVGLLAFTLALWTWHAPALYELALRDAGWHRIEHATFLAGALLFWFPVIRPWPALDTTPRWTIPPMLLLAGLVAGDRIRVAQEVISGSLPVDQRKACTQQRRSKVMNSVKFLCVS